MNRAFTLVELLIVVAVIALLIALLVPVATRSRDMGARAACLSNVRQIARAVNLAFSEENGYLPNRGPDPLYWGKAAEDLLPYLGGDYTVFRCPSNRGAAHNANTELPDHTGRHTDYEMNGYLCSTDGNRVPITVITTWSQAAYAYDYPYYPGAEGRAHKGGINVAYLDGHAAWLPDEEMGPLDPSTEETFYRKGHIF